MPSNGRIPPSTYISSLSRTALCSCRGYWAPFRVMLGSVDHVPAGAGDLMGSAALEAHLAMINSVVKALVYMLKSVTGVF